MWLVQAQKTDTEDSAAADGATTGVEGDSDTPSLGAPAVPSTEFLLSAEADAKAVAKRRCVVVLIYSAMYGEVAEALCKDVQD